MKELSIEEKAKAYDEAKINGSRLWECGEITRTNYEYMFPELKESEDERIRKEIIEFIERNKKTNAPIPSDPYLDNWIAWLKKQGEQKPWSEEDIATISRVISIVKWAAYSDHSHPILNDKGATELVERLKSLKQRYTWKPSDEQMEALEHFARSIGESGYTSSCDNNTKLIYSLLEQLKKLK